jgi:hypothetical protein
MKNTYELQIANKKIAVFKTLKAARQYRPDPVLTDLDGNFTRIIKVLKPTARGNFFPTLNDALAAENLLESWECTQAPIGYGETRSYTWQDGTRHGHLVSIYRDTAGRYERPVHYAR